ncbi:hypothetical protein HZU77_001485, partial [Neisseriaceae bacterium TC5R-5]|nr:hypothetical protein [Neisseriaceae bacterium TC5R-5]
YTYRLFSLLKSVSASSQNPSCWPVSAEVANYTHTNESRQHHFDKKMKIKRNKTGRFTISL